MSLWRGDKRQSLIAQQAARVLITSKDEPHSPLRHRQMLNWLRRSREHLFILLEMMYLDGVLDRKKLLDRTARLEGKTSVPPSAGIGSSASRPCTSSTALCRFVTGRTAFAAAAVALVLLGVSISVTRTNDEAVRHVSLPDGSVMHIARGSDYEIAFREQIRLVELPRGEAVFEVAKDPRRPFVVRSGLSDTVAVGTRFSVVSDASATITTVAEGAVRVVAPAGADLATGTIVNAGEEFQVLAGASTPEPVTAVDAGRKLSWATGWLMFDGETVGDAVRTFNRFSDTRIEITQPELTGTRLTFQRFAIDQPEAFANGIAATLNVPASTDSARKVIYVGNRRP